MLQIAHKFDACALFGMPGMCTWYMVHGMRYEVRGMWYVVQGTEYVALGTRCKTPCMIIEQNELVPEICLYEVEVLS